MTVVTIHNDLMKKTNHRRLRKSWSLVGCIEQEFVHQFADTIYKVKFPLRRRLPKLRLCKDNGTRGSSSVKSRFENFIFFVLLNSFLLLFQVHMTNQRLQIFVRKGNFVYVHI